MSHVYHKAYNLNISLLRFFTVYGPRGRPDMAPMMFTKRILNGETIKMFGEGDTSRSYTYVDDVVAGTIAALDNPKPYEIYNIGNDKTVTLKDFISILEDICGRKAIIQKEPRHPADVPLTYASIEKAKEMLGYNPETDVKEGLRKMVDWYKERF